MDFLDQYFINPIYDQSLGFNYINTVTYALIALVILYAFYQIFKKLNIKIDMNFFWALLPFIVLGATTRAFVDHEYITYSFWTVTPGVYLMIASVFLAAFAVAYTLQHFRKYPWTKTCMYIGWVLVAINVFLASPKVEFANLWGAAAIVGLATGICLLLYFIFRFTKKELTEKIVFLPFIAHMLDASATFIGVDFFGYWEKHPVTRGVSELAGTTAVFYLLKLLFLIPLVYLLTKEIKDKNLKNYLLLIVVTLGLAEGLRDLITIILL